jgi:hypothetical protein
MNLRSACVTNVHLPHFQSHPAIIIKLLQDTSRTLPAEPDDYRQGNHYCAESWKPVGQKIKCFVNIILSFFYSFHDFSPFVLVYILQRENRATGSPPDLLHKINIL